MDSRKNLFVLSAPSATGKNTVFDLLTARVPSIRRVITATTRNPRKNEVNGVDYYFLTDEEFVAKAQKGGFVEQNRYDKHYYGSPVDEIEAYPETTPLFMIVDPNGMKQVIKRYPNTTSIFLMPPSIEELERRIRGRGDNTDDEIQRRIDQARLEIESSELYDYIVVNDDLDACVARIVDIVLSRFPE